MHMEKRTLMLFTRTPLHVGAGSSVGAIDQPIQRERHTRFPIVPGSSIKGVLSSLWRREGKNRGVDAVWLFGSDDANNACAGSVMVGEAKLLAFPVRSAKGCFAWLVSPVVLARFARDTGKSLSIPQPGAADRCLAASSLVLEQGGKSAVILEEYVLETTPDAQGINTLTAELKPLLADVVWQEVEKRLVVVSDEMLAYFAENACEVAQHIRIDDETGTVADGALFNQENVPSETLFYATLRFQTERSANAPRPPQAAAEAIRVRLAEAGNLLQLGADESTGLGWCTARLID